MQTILLSASGPMRTRFGSGLSIQFCVGFFSFLLSFYCAIFVIVALVPRTLYTPVFLVFVAIYRTNGHYFCRNAKQFHIYITPIITLIVSVDGG